VRRAAWFRASVLVNAVLSRKFSPFDRSIDMHVSKVRKKLGDTDNDEHIKTIRGVGYIFARPREKVGEKVKARHEEPLPQDFSFLLGGAGIVSCARDPGDAGPRPQRNSTWEALRTTALTDAIERLRAVAGHRRRTNTWKACRLRSMCAPMFSMSRELRFQGVRAGLGRACCRWQAPAAPHPGMVFPRPQILTESRASSDGHHLYTIAMELPPGPRVFLGPWGIPMPGLIIAVLSSGLVCYFLAWYMTKPVTRLRAATQQLAAGDLTARAGDPQQQKAR
jgi:hypothetical protein